MPDRKNNENKIKFNDLFLSIKRIQIELNKQIFTISQWQCWNEINENYQNMPSGIQAITCQKKKKTESKK